MYFGWSCMSWRHPETHRAAPNMHADKGTTDSTEDTKGRPRVSLCGFCVRVASLCPLVCVSVRGNGGHLTRVERLEKVTRGLQIEVRIGLLDAEEEPVAAREREAGHVEDRVVRLRQPVERQHAQHRRQRGDENRALEGDRDERRPAVKRLPADVH